MPATAPQARDVRLRPYRLWLAEYDPRSRGRTLHLIHTTIGGRPFVVGEQLEGMGVALGKTYSHVTVGRFAPVGLDGLEDVVPDGTGVTCTFVDGARAWAPYDPAAGAARCACAQDEQGVCAHTLAAFYVAGAHPQATWGDTAHHDQLRAAYDRYMADRANPLHFVQCIDAGYVYLKGVAQVVIRREPPGPAVAWTPGTGSSATTLTLLGRDDRSAQALVDGHAVYVDLHDRAACECTCGQATCGHIDALARAL